MAQVSSYNVANRTGAQVRADINDIYEAIKTCNSGTSDPSTPVKFMLYGDSAVGDDNLKIYDGAQFRTIGKVTEDNLGLLPKAGGTLTGTLNFGSTAVTSIKETTSNNNLAFLTNSTERWQINSAGSLFSLPNSSKETNTATNFLTDAGAAFYQNGSNFEALSLVKSGTNYATALYINRKGSGDGIHIEFAKDDSLKGQIGNSSDDLFINAVAANLNFRISNTDRWAVNSLGGFQWKEDLCRDKYDLGNPSSSPAFQNNVASGVIRLAGITSRRGTGNQAATANSYNFFWDDYTTSTDHLEAWVDNVFVGDVTLVTSDYRIKRNVNLQTESGINKIKNLKPVTYQLADYNEIFKSKDDIREGFIAHEVQEVIPSAVNREKDVENSLQTLNLDAIVSVLTKALQEAVAKIETLEAKVAALEAS